MFVLGLRLLAVVVVVVIVLKSVLKFSASGSSGP